MQLITVNIWGGKIFDPLFNFIAKHKNKTDFFLFQEVFRSNREVITHHSHSNVLKDLVEALPQFNHYYSPTAEGHDTRGPVDFPLDFGQATFIKSEINVSNQGNIFVHRSFNKPGPYYPDGRVDFPRNFIFSEIEKEGKKFQILNLHGFWEPAPKHDTEQRLRQSQIIIDHVQQTGLPTILAGDFNLGINTQSLKMFENNGFRNLVKESGALTTRSTLYHNKWRSHDKFADYILTTKGIWVTDFKVMRAKVSDHLPLFLKFEV